jgi:indole-3-glycerol phosphate synthase/phosphoribosylanthranilate isomerase
MANVLEKIIVDKRAELQQRKIDRPLDSFINDVVPTTRDFYAELAKPGTNYILECKKASPSKGLIRENFDLAEIAGVYKHYAACISVLTDEKYFQGSYAYLREIRQLVEQPLICKDFFVDPYQVYLARLCGGDAILLMLSVLNDEEYSTLAKLAQSLNMAVLTEVSNEQEVHRALNLDAAIIGINNRNLRDLSTDLATTEQLRKLIPNDKVVISESGIYTHSDVKRLKPLCNGFLVGSSLMAEPQLDLACRKLVLGENKVCGLTRADDAIAAYNAGAVFGGLIFYKKSPRFVDIKRAEQIINSCPLGFVGVFVNETIETIVNTAQALNLVAVQLHGDENDAYIAELKSLLPSVVSIWKAIGVQDKVNFSCVGADRYLFDTKVANQSGGTGQTFDWQLLTDQQDFMLAGGLNSQNVKAALNTSAIGLDFNSGVEIRPGEKCSQQINNVVSQIKES